MSQKMKDIADDLRQIATEIDNELTVKPLDVKRGNVTLAEAFKMLTGKLGNEAYCSIQVDVTHSVVGFKTNWKVYDGKEFHEAKSLDGALSKFMESRSKPEPTDLDAVTEILDGVKPEKIEEPAF